MLTGVIALPERDNLNTTKLSVRVDPSPAGVTTLFHEGVDEPNVVGSNTVIPVLMSETPKRIASRKPSRPPPNVLLPVVRTRLWLPPVDVVGKSVTDEASGFTLPLCVTTVLAYPKPTFPLTVIRTGGRK